MSKTVDMEIKKLDQINKEVDNREVQEFKAILKNDIGNTKLTVKYDSKSRLENLLGALKVGQKVQMKLSNNQTKLDDHVPEPEGSHE